MLPMQKGGSLPLTKNSAPLNEIRLELSWSPPQHSAKGSYDLDTSAFPLNSQGGGPMGAIADVGHICYWGQQKTPSMEHLLGDSRSGDAEGPDEAILIRLHALPANCDVVALVATIDKATARGQTFAEVADASMRVYNQQTDELLCQVDLAALDAGSTGCLFASIRKQGQAWSVENVNQGYPGKELPDFFHLFGYQG
ncbi:TerD family protein [Chromobacterium subtsugae]|uniref:TerD family protein n=1 Tax=Chromobacterium subtsugae TaxID=251747 RepID=A0ABS7FM17_9NEIS|nr:MULTISPECIES: TerD family protein [Chromobacterium]MBW7569202.1 TerD family protein [Chromobacterium subtsugae]MBW8290319.1 TerD family protein [Chromobacterium subtsugae]WSE93261.1 TerD family protein [Chromobacterium subtsugae]WVH61639.1 TerD family protein [Chromobacterium subtsugae]